MNSKQNIKDIIEFFKVKYDIDIRLSKDSYSENIPSFCINTKVGFSYYILQFNINENKITFLHNNIPTKFSKNMHNDVDILNENYKSYLLLKKRKFKLEKLKMNG